MIQLADLWLPIVAAAAFVFVASSLVHMALRWHKHDFGRVPGEDRVLEAIRAAGLQPGSYRFPFCESMQEMGSPEMKAKLDRGPVGTMTLIPPGQISMGKSLGQWFLLCIVVSVLVAYLASLTLSRGAEGMQVLRVTASAALLGYAFSSVTDSIWKGVSWSITVRFVLDGILYALVTGAAFAWLWPGAIAAH